MNASFDNSESESDAIESQAPPAVPQPPLRSNNDWRYWARRLLVCNPFFLCSAALLLFGVNRLSLDPSLFGDETRNLYFNFGALQIYGGLIAVTATVLSRRRVWYDSALLVVLEHGLVLVPFILISQAALIGASVARTLVLFGAAAAVGRALLVSRWYPQFNLPPRALLLGAFILAGNVALPLWFRSVVNATSVDDWPRPNAWVWLGALPVMAAGANWLPRPARYSRLNPERSWLPIFIYGFWLAGSAVHAWSVAYLGKGADITLSMLAPLSSVICWTLWNRLSDFVERPALWAEKLCLVSASAAPLLALDHWQTLLPLVLGNVIMLGFLSFRGSDGMRAWARTLAALSICVVPFCAPEGAASALPFGLTPLSVSLLYLACWAAGLGWRFRHPAYSIAAGLGFVLYAGNFHPLLESAIRWHIALAAILCHSVRWQSESDLAKRMRTAAAIIWLGISYFGADSFPSETAVSIGFGSVVSVSWLIGWRMTGRRGAWVTPASGTLVALSRPILAAAVHGSVGLWSVFGSFILFGAGAALAWKRQPKLSAQ